MSKNNALDFRRACSALVRLFYADGWELVVEKATGNYAAKSAMISTRARMPFGLSAIFDGGVWWEAESGKITMRLSPPNTPFPRMYAEYNDGSWEKLEWNVLVDMDMDEEEGDDDGETDEGAASDH